MQTTVDPAVEADYREKGWWGTDCLTDVIRRLAATNPQGTAFVDEHGDRMSWSVYDEVSDRIALALGGDEELLAAAREHEAYIAGETLATSVDYGADGTGEKATIEGRELRIAVSKA